MKRRVVTDRPDGRPGLARAHLDLTAGSPHDDGLTRGDPFGGHEAHEIASFDGSSGTESCRNVSIEGQSHARTLSGFDVG